MGIYIWVGVLVLLLLLLFVPVIIELEYADAIQLLRFKFLGFIRFTVFPVNPKREERKRKREEKAKAKKAAKPTKKTKTKPKKTTKKKKPPAKKMLLMDIVQTINDIMPIAGKMFGGWLRGVTVKKCLVSLVIYNEDYYESAMTCGKLYGILYSAYTYLASIAKVKHFKLLVNPNFVNEKNSTVVELDIRMSIATLLGGLICFLFRGGLSLYKGPLFAKNGNKKTKTTQGV